MKPRLKSYVVAPDDVYQALQAQFSEQEQVTLTMMIVGFRVVSPLSGARQAA